MLKAIKIISVTAVIFNMGLGALVAEANTLIKPQEMATLAEARGTVEVKPAAGKAVWVAGAASTSLVQGDMIRTGTDSAATIRINEGAGSIVVELANDSLLSIVKLMTNVSTGTKDILLSLDLGEATIKTKDTDQRSKFEIKTPTSIVSSNGGSSSFSVNAEFSK
jgi:hypothetical protein